MKLLPLLLLGLLGLAVHTSGYPQEDLNLPQIEDESSQPQLPIDPECCDDDPNDHIDVLTETGTDEELPAWKADYYAALDTLDDDLAVARRDVEVKVPAKLVKRKGGGAADNPKDNGNKWYKPWKKGSPPEGSSTPKDSGQTSLKKDPPPSPKDNSGNKDNPGSKGNFGNKDNSGNKDNGYSNYDPSYYSNIYPRKGGGATGGRGFTSGGKTSGGKTSGGKGSSPGTDKKSNEGGLSRGGTGPPPKYKKYYSGGGKTPYSAGKKSPGGLSPVALSLAIAGGLFAGAWLGSVWMYAWNHPLKYNHDPTAGMIQIPYQNLSMAGNGTDMTFEITPGKNVTLPVKCLCGNNAVCGCDEVSDADYAKSVLEDAAKGGGKGDTARLAVDNGELVLVINGTLPNGTTADGGNGYSSGGLELRVGRGVVRGWAMVWVGVVVGGAVLGGLI